MFVIWFFFSLLSLSSIGEGAVSSRDLVFVAVVDSRRPSFFFMLAHVGGREREREVFGACRREEKGRQKKERPV